MVVRKNRSQEEPVPVETKKVETTETTGTFISDNRENEETLLERAKNVFEDEGGSTILSHDEAIRQAEKDGIPKTIVEPVLKSRKIILTVFAALTVCVLFSIGIITGLGIAKSMAKEAANAPTVVDVTEGTIIDPPYQQDIDVRLWMRGYQEGFRDGANFSNERFYGYNPNDLQFLPGTELNTTESIPTIP